MDVWEAVEEGRDEWLVQARTADNKIYVTLKVADEDDAEELAAKLNELSQDFEISNA